MNQAILSGNLTADIEDRSVGEHLVSKFTLACNEGERVVFLPVEAWDMAHLSECLAKGSKVLVSGFLKQDQWETEAGEKRSRILLNARRVEFINPARTTEPAAAGAGERRSEARTSKRSSKGDWSRRRAR